jgi:hypothetical protein
VSRCPPTPGVGTWDGFPSREETPAPKEGFAPELEPLHWVATPVTAGMSPLDLRYTVEIVPSVGPTSASRSDSSVPAVAASFAAGKNLPFSGKTFPDTERPVIRASWFAVAEVSMCEACKELDAKIEHYLRLATMIRDEKTIDGLNKLVEELRQKRAALHPEQAQCG